MPPDSDVEALSAGAAQLGLALQPQQIDRLVAYGGLLAHWNAVHNLTAIRSGEGIRTHHLLDSLSLLPQFVRVTGGAAARTLDVGSGGGLPGLVLAIAAPQAQVTLIDSVQKKCAFLLQARLELRLDNVEVVHSRVEALRAPEFDVIVSRALATLAQFVGWTRHLLRRDGVWLAMKGRQPEDEIAALPEDVRAVAVLPLVVPGLGQQRHLVEMRWR